LELINEKYMIKRDRVDYMKMKNELLSKEVNEKEQTLRRREKDHVQMPPLEPDQFHSQPPIEGSRDKQFSDYTTQ
jgi:hypothetical protein